MRFRFLLIVALPALLLASTACLRKSATLSNAGKIASQTPSAAAGDTSTPRPTADPNSLGPAPALGGNITAISPTHGQKVKQSQTKSPNPNTPGGLCVDVTFDGLPENAQWFRIAFDDSEVTEKLVWIVKSTEAPKDGRVCYSPVNGFTTGIHSAAISVQDPRNPQATTRQIVAWKFEVVP